MKKILRDATRRVLIVEDNVICRRALSMLLRDLGHEVDEAWSGEDAVEFYNANIYDVVFCDVGLPGLTGDDVCQHIRDCDLRDHVKTSIIIVTASNVDGRIKPANYDCVCVKPVTIDIMKLIEPYMNNRKSEVGRG